MPTVILNPLGDTYINSTTPAVNHGADVSMLIGNFDPIAPATTYRMWRGLLRFDLSAIPANAYAFSAILSLYNAGTDPVGSGTMPISAYQVLQNWNAAQATWTDRLTATAWNTAGCDGADIDYDTTVLATNLVPETTAGWRTWNITTLVREWIWGDVTNYGVILANYIPTTFSGTTKEFYSNNWGVAGQRPILTITYELAPDIPTMTPEPAFTIGIDNTVAWSDEAATGAIEYFPQSSTDVLFDTGIETLANIDREEYIAPANTTSLTTFFSIGYVEGIYTNPLKTGTNYYAGGSFLGPAITLGTALPSIGTVSFDGTGLNNLTTSGTYTLGSTHKLYVIKISSTGIPDKFDWSDDNGNTWTTAVTITGAAQLLSSGISITFATTTGHTLNDEWSFTGKVYPAYVFYKTNGWLPLKLKGTFATLIDGTKYYYHVKCRNGNKALVDEPQTSISTTKVVTSFVVISVAGVWLATDPAHAGTNYYTGGSFSGNTLTLGTPLPGATTAVLINYTGLILAESNWSSSTFSTQDDSINSLQLLSPNGTEVWDGGLTKTIQWIATDTSSGLTTNANLYRSADSGDTWTLLASSANVNSVYEEAQTSITDRRVYTEYYIKDVTAVYLASDPLSIGSATFTGGGLNDLTTSGTYTSNITKNYKIIIDGTVPDKFSWSDNGGVTWNATAVPITGGAQSLNSGVVITFGAILGHTLGNYWTFTAGHLGTNFYTGGSFDLREITLATPLPTEETDVIIDYITYGAYSWSVPTNIDSANSRIKVKVTDTVGNELEDISDKDFTVITIKNRLHRSVYNIESGSNVDNLMKTYAYNEQLISHADDDVKRGYTIEYAENTDLDLHGAGYGVTREPEENDQEYRSRIINNLTSLKNTKQAILDAVAPYVNNAWIYEWMGNWEDDYCFFLDWSFLDYRDYLTGGMFPGIDGAPYTFELHVNPKPINRVERLVSSATNIVYTDYAILYLEGVFDNPDLAGTNYYEPIPDGNFTVGPPTYIPIGVPGTDDFHTRGYYLGGINKTYKIEIDSIGAVDTFKWSTDNGVTWLQTLVPITGSDQQLIYVGPSTTIDDNIYIKFDAVNTHTSGDAWSFLLRSNIISLGTNLLNPNTTVYVKYTPQTILRKIAEVVDLVKPAGVLPYIILELGSYYGENYYAEFLYGL